MKLIYVFNFITLQLKLLFLFFYKNIPYYTRYKSNPNKSWFKYVNESYSIVEKNLFLLVLYIMYLFISEHLLRFYTKFTFVNSFFRIIQVHIFQILSGKNIFLINFKPRISSDGYTSFYSKQVFFKKNDLNFTNFIYLLYFYLKSLLCSVIVTVLFFTYLIYFFNISFLKQLAIWFIVGNLFFWLISGFNFFLKRYAFSKFTSAIQRFWKRANVCFWAIEGFLFLLFYYYYLNSSQEPLYMYDYSSLNQDFLLNLETGYSSLFILGFLFYLFTFILLSINFFSFYQLVFFLIFSSIFIFFIFFIESYQFFYLISQFTESIWVYSEEANSWKLSYESPRLKSKNYYFSMCLIAKYWHFIFIFLSWVFFIVKSFEYKRISYTLLSYNMQNFLILFLLNLLTYSQWLKFLFRRFLDLNYFWFYTKYDYNYMLLAIHEVKVFGVSILNFFHINVLHSFNFSSFYSNSFFLYGNNFLFNII